MNKTAVEWLYEQFLDGRHHTDKEYKEIFEEAKEMEKQEIEKAITMEKLTTISQLEDALAFMDKAVKVLDDYLNAGTKEARREVSKKAKDIYEEYHGIKYVNRNERFYENPKD